MIRPTAMEIATTATDCFMVDSLSGHEIFLNSAFRPLKKLGFEDFSAESPITASHPAPCRRPSIQPKSGIT